MIRRGGAWGAAVCVLLCASILYARPGVVRTRDGQTFQGEVQERGDDVVVTIRNIPTRIPRERIASIEYIQSPEQAFNDRMARLDPKDVDGRLQLAREAIAQRQYALARNALESVLQIDNNNREAVDMLETVRSLMRLERKNPPGEAARPPAPAEARPAEAGAADAPAPAEPAPPIKVLSPAQINAMKQGEMGEDERDIRVRFERNVQRRFVDYSPDYQPAEFFALTPIEQARVILTRGLPEMSKDVIIMNDPASILQFRRSVQPYLLQNCATAGCHGGQAPKFNMVLPPEGDAATYTNFYIVTRYTKATKQQSDTIFGRGELKIVDRQRPGESLLVHYSVPPQIAAHDHPEMTGYRAPLRGVNDARYVLLMNWIQSLVPVDPDYGFEINVSATQPATAPATTQAEPADSPPAATPPRPAAPQVRPQPPARPGQPRPAPPQPAQPQPAQPRPR